jgi:hypothetical protein
MMADGVAAISRGAELSLAPGTPVGVVSPAPSGWSALRRIMQALSTLDPRRGPAPWQPPLGPFHFPKPLEIQVFFHAVFRSIMPQPRYSGSIVVLSGRA